MAYLLSLMSKFLAIATFLIVAGFSTSHVALAYGNNTPYERLPNGGMCTGATYALTPEFLVDHPNGFGGSWDPSSWSVFSSIARYNVFYGGITGDPILEGRDFDIISGTTTGAGWPQMSASEPEERSYCLNPDDLNGYGTITMMVDTEDGVCEANRIGVGDWTLVDCFNAGGEVGARWDVSSLTGSVYTAFQKLSFDFAPLEEVGTNFISSQSALLEATGISGVFSYNTFKGLVAGAVDFGLWLVQVSWPFLLGIAFIYLMWRLAKRFQFL